MSRKVAERREVIMAETYEDAYQTLLTRPVPQEGFILPRTIEEIIRSMHSGDQAISDRERLLQEFYRLVTSAVQTNR